MPKRSSRSSRPTARPSRGCLRSALLPLLLLLIAASALYQCSRQPANAPVAPSLPADTVPIATSPPTASMPEPTLLTSPISSSSDDAVPFTVAGWNIGLDDADPAVIASSLAAFEGVDLWGLSEISRVDAAPELETGAEEGENADFGRVLGASGRDLRLLALYDTTRFDLLGSKELDAINTTGNVRAPLVLHLRDKLSGQEFLFMVNHLYRSKDAERLKQAQLLNAWAAEQSLPVIAVGDYNFDWAVPGGGVDHDVAYDAFTADGVWRWVKPAELVTTQCSGWPCRYESVLDFVFVAGPAQAWRAESEIVVQPGDFPDDATTSDHRAVVAEIWVR